MTKKMKAVFSVIAPALLLMASLPASADTINVVLTSPVQNAQPGSPVTFEATVSAASTNTGTIYLNGDSYTLSGLFTVDDTDFLLNFPFSLDPGASATADLFTVTLLPGVPYGSYNGFFSILGGSDPFALDTIGTATFDVQVTPEPQTVALLGTGLLGLAIILMRRRAFATQITN
jgi:hypothetical protein